MSTTISCADGVFYRCNRKLTGPLHYTPSVTSPTNVDCITDGCTLILLCAGSPLRDHNKMMAVDLYDANGDLGSLDRYNAAAAAIPLASKFIVVGGSSEKVMAMKQFLIDRGADASAVRALNCNAQGATSRGNMAALAQVLPTEEYADDDLVLLTSYFHLPRVILFARFGLPERTFRRLRFVSADHIMQNKKQPAMPTLADDIPVIARERVPATTIRRHTVGSNGAGSGSGGGGGGGGETDGDDAEVEECAAHTRLVRNGVPEELKAMLLDALSLHTERMAARYANELNGLRDWASGRYGPGSREEEEEEEEEEEAEGDDASGAVAS